ncbi:MAG: OsmC family protein [Chloroflexi bacterium]|nr:OsmC family protein [Chloroflexota bacterium]MCH7655457.1 OsmC family protein [Chloroflexota bacterium]
MFSQLTRYAAELDIQIDDAEMDIRASYDTQGKLLLSDASPGAEWLHYVIEINSPAPSEKIEELVAMIEKGCHTINTIRQPTPVSGKIIHNGTELDIEL